MANNSDEQAAKSEKVPEDGTNENQKPAKETSDTKPKLEAEGKPEEAKTEKKRKEAQVVVDKELLEVLFLLKKIITSRMLFSSSQLVKTYFLSGFLKFDFLFGPGFQIL